VFEVVDRSGRQLGLEDIVAMLPGVTGTAAIAEVTEKPKWLYDRIRAIARPGQLDDDFSALVFRFP
jgi:hypothetical protein